MAQKIETGLPAWVYLDEDFFALEHAKIFKPSWQIVCHESDVAEAGAYSTLNFMGALVLVIRGDDGEVRAFHNVCRHRGARLLDDAFGDCTSRLVCPYHAWTYDLKGRLVGMPARESYADLDIKEFGLRPLESQSCGGFIFVRMSDRAPSFDEFILPLKAEFEIYDTKNMRALGRISARERRVNWKIAVENYVDALHLPVAHHGLDGLVGDSYSLKLMKGGYHIDASILDVGGQTISGRAYREFLPETPHLPLARQSQWVYKQIWPNLAFDFYPDQVDFMQFIPLSPGCTLLREISYALPDERRGMRAARYLNWRINREVNVEDKDVIERVQAGLSSGDYEPGPISNDEICLRDFAARMRQKIPMCQETKHPGTDKLRKNLNV